MENTDEKIVFLILSLEKKDALMDYRGYTNIIDLYQAARLQYIDPGEGKGGG